MTSSDSTQRIPDGYLMPAEWEPHEATWIAWPHNPETWPGRMRFIPPIWIQMIKPLHVHEKVHLCVNSPEMEAEVTAILRRHDIGPNVILHQFPTNDAWMRDYGTIFIRGKIPLSPRTPHLSNHLSDRSFRSSGRDKPDPADPHSLSPLIALDFIFNSWGQKYGPCDLDDVIPQQVAKYLGIPCHQPGIVLEGGSIDVNGRGTLLTTEQCLLNKNRNPHLSKSEIEQSLKDHLGVTNILWLGDGIVGDDTDGHVDDLARFVNPTTVVTVVEEDPADANYKPLQDNLKRLRSMKDQDGHPLNVLTLPMPGPVVYQGQRLPASYANFYIGNGVVLLPIFGHKNDEMATLLLRQLFPERRIVGINAVEMVWGLGAFHCVTQQQPKVGQR